MSERVAPLGVERESGDSMHDFASLFNVVISSPTLLESLNEKRGLPDLIGKVIQECNVEQMKRILPVVQRLQIVEETVSLSDLFRVLLERSGSLGDIFCTTIGDHIAQLNSEIEDLRNSLGILGRAEGSFTLLCKAEEGERRLRAKMAEVDEGLDQIYSLVRQLGEDSLFEEETLGKVGTVREKLQSELNKAAEEIHIKRRAAEEKWEEARRRVEENLGIRIEDRLEADQIESLLSGKKEELSARLEAELEKRKKWKERLNDNWEGFVDEVLKDESVLERISELMGVNTPEDEENKKRALELLRELVGGEIKRRKDLLNTIKALQEQHREGAEIKRTGMERATPIDLDEMREKEAVAEEEGPETEGEEPMQKRLTEEAPSKQEQEVVPSEKDEGEFDLVRNSIEDIIQGAQRVLSDSRLDKGKVRDIISYERPVKLGKDLDLSTGQSIIAYYTLVIAALREFRRKVGEVIYLPEIDEEGFNVTHPTIAKVLKEKVYEEARGAEVRVVYSREMTVSPSAERVIVPDKIKEQVRGEREGFGKWREDIVFTGELARREADLFSVRWEDLEKASFGQRGLQGKFRATQELLRKIEDLKREEELPLETAWRLVKEGDFGFLMALLTSPLVDEEFKRVPSSEYEVKAAPFPIPVINSTSLLGALGEYSKVGFREYSKLLDPLLDKIWVAALGFEGGFKRDAEVSKVLDFIRWRRRRDFNLLSIDAADLKRYHDRLIEDYRHLEEKAKKREEEIGRPLTDEEMWNIFTLNVEVGSGYSADIDYLPRGISYDDLKDMNITPTELLRWGVTWFHLAIIRWVVKERLKDMGIRIERSGDGAELRVGESWGIRLSGEFLEKLSEALREKEAPKVFVLMGLHGEGKSTSLNSIAALLLALGVKVNRQKRGQFEWISRLGESATSEPLVLVVDEAAAPDLLVSDERAESQNVRAQLAIVNRITKEIERLIAKRRIQPVLVTRRMSDRVYTDISLADSIPTASRYLRSSNLEYTIIRALEKLFEKEK